MNQTRDHKILLIDDDSKLGELLKSYLQKFGYVLDHSVRPSLGLTALSNEDYDLVLLDIMMLEQDGLSVCKEIRMTSDIPIIMLSARGDVTDRVVGLEIGADDYVPKPFEPRELVARISAILKRATLSKKSPKKDVRNFGPLSINASSLRVSLDGQDVSMTSTETQLLMLLSSEPDKVFSRDEIVGYFSGVDSDVYSRSVDIMVSRIRTKLNDKTQSYIRTVRGVGYKFVGSDK